MSRDSCFARLGLLIDLAQELIGRESISGLLRAPFVENDSRALCLGPIAIAAPVLLFLPQALTSEQGESIEGGSRQSGS
jgi:hypothetical protein